MLRRTAHVKRLHVFLQPKQPKQQGTHGNDAAHGAYVGQANMSAHHATNEGACANAKIEDAREDAHGHRCAFGRSNIDNFALHSNVEGGAHHAPQRQQQQCYRYAARYWQQHGYARTNNNKAARIEGVTVTGIIAREGHTAQYACHAKQHERSRYQRVIHAHLLFQEGLDIAVCCIVGGGKEGREQEDACKRAYSKQLWQLFTENLPRLGNTGSVAYR